jgi:hypothetical protein
VLEGLDAVPWKQLTHAYGSAGDVPKLIRAAASADKQTRRDAWHRLYGNLWHQGTIYEATAHAVPFFIELAQSPGVPDRDWILGYLVNLAEGTSYNDVHQHAKHLADRRNASKFQQQRQRELGWVEETRAAVRLGRHAYAALLKDGVPVHRAVAAHLLSLFPQDAQEHIAWLQAHLAASEPDERARAWCVLSVGRLAKHEQTAGAWLNETLQRDGADAVRTAASLGLAWCKGGQLPRAAHELLRKHASDPGPAAALFEHMPWDAGNDVLEHYCSEALGLIRDPGDDSLESLIAAMNEVAAYQAIEIMRSLLGRVFSRRPMARTMTVDRLTADQRAVLEAIASSRKLWYDLSGTVLVTPVIAITNEFALPTNVTRLRAFLDGRLSSDDENWSKPFLPPTKAGIELAARLRSQAKKKWIKERRQKKPSSPSGGGSEQDE